MLTFPIIVPFLSRHSPNTVPGTRYHKTSSSPRRGVSTSDYLDAFLKIHLFWESIRGFAFFSNRPYRKILIFDGFLQFFSCLQNVIFPLFIPFLLLQSKCAFTQAFSLYHPHKQHKTKTFASTEKTSGRYSVHLEISATFLLSTS